MKKILICFICLFIFNNLFSEATKEKPVYKTFSFLDKEESFWAIALDIKEYDSTGKLIYTKTTGDLYSLVEPVWVETWYQYDNKGNNVYKFNSYDRECWMDYDSNGNLIHELWSTGLESFYEYNSKNKLIHESGPLGDEWRDYDDNGNLIHLKNWNGEEWYDYDSSGHEIHYKLDNGFEGWYDYDENGFRIHFKNMNGFEHWYTNNSNGQEIHYVDTNGNECWHDYNDKGQETYEYNYGAERWTEYEYYDDGKTLKRQVIYKRNTNKL